MPDRILYEGPGFTIAIIDDFEATVPYKAELREEGNQNYGFKNLVEKPELIDQIPEAKESPGLGALLSSINLPASRLMTIGCA